MYQSTALEVFCDMYFLAQYKAIAEASTAHHILLFGCSEPFRETQTWLVIHIYCVLMTDTHYIYARYLDCRCLLFISHTFNNQKLFVTYSCCGLF